MAYKAFIILVILVVVLLIGFGVWNTLDYKARVAKTQEETAAFTRDYVPPPKIGYVGVTDLCGRPDLNSAEVHFCARDPEDRAAWDAAHPKEAAQAQRRAQWQQTHP